MDGFICFFSHDGANREGIGTFLREIVYLRSPHVNPVGLGDSSLVVVRAAVIQSCFPHQRRSGYRSALSEKIPSGKREENGLAVAGESAPAYGYSLIFRDVPRGKVRISLFTLPGSICKRAIVSEETHHLFGIRHPPEAAPFHAGNIVLCSGDYINVQRHVRLSGIGFHLSQISVLSVVSVVVLAVGFALFRFSPGKIGSVCLFGR